MAHKTITIDGRDYTFHLERRRYGSWMPKTYTWITGIQDNQSGQEIEVGAEDPYPAVTPSKDYFEYVLRRWKKKKEKKQKTPCTE